MIFARQNRPLVTPRIPRRFRRIPFRIECTVSGRDYFGNQFEEQVETGELSSNGGSFLSKIELKVGATLKLKGPTGSVFLIRVAWMSEEVAALRRVGFQLLEAREDWVFQSQRTGACCSEYTCLGELES